MKESIYQSFYQLFSGVAIHGMVILDGYEATRRAKVIFPDLQIIALTAYTQPEEERRALEAGCSAFISKPIRNQELIESIRRCIRN